VRILFAALTMPFPPTNGHRLRTWALLRALAGDGHRLALVAFADPGELKHPPAPELSALCESVDMLRTPDQPEALGRLRALASSYPYGVFRFRSRAFANAVTRHLDRGHFDAVVCDGIYNVQNLPQRSQIPVLLNKDDVATVILRRYLALERNPARWLYGRIEAGKVRRWERYACRYATASLVCSDVDRAVLEALWPGGTMLVAPNVVDTDHYVPAGPGDPLTVLYQGGMDWYPNRDAVEFFAFRILPELRRRVPGLVFRVAGRSPSAAFRRRIEAIANVEFTGPPPDMRAEIAKASVCVVPLRIGSGTRLKIIEAGAMAKPIVSTRLGAEGLDFRDGEEIVLADEPVEFATAVAALLADGGRRASLGLAARRRVEKEHSYPIFQSSIREALGQLVRTR